jgi:hypothetical protein
MLARLGDLGEVGLELGEQQQVDQVAVAVVGPVFEALGDRVELGGDLVAQRLAGDLVGTVEAELGKAERGDLFGLCGIGLGWGGLRRNVAQGLCL